MKKILKIFPAIFLLIFLLIQWSCTDTEQPGNITFFFDHSVEGEELELENMIYKTPVGHDFSVSRLKYYVSNYVLHKSDGSKVEVDKIHYREFGIDETRSMELGEIDAGEYDEISFVFGLDEVTNVDNGLENKQTNINMEWPLPGDQGYHYMKFEGKYDSLGTGTIKNFNLHTGATMGNQNYIEISIPLDPFSVNDNNWEVYLNMDLIEWFQNPNNWDFEEFGQFIMANQNAQDVLKQNGSTVFSIEKVIQN